MTQAERRKTKEVENHRAAKLNRYAASMNADAAYFLEEAASYRQMGNKALSRLMRLTAEGYRVKAKKLGWKLP